MQTVIESVGRQLRRRRKILGMSQQQLAAQVGVRFQQIQKYECGQNKISSDRLFQLAEILKVTPNYFFERCKFLQEHENVPELDRHTLEIMDIAEGLPSELRMHALHILRALPQKRISAPKE